MIINLKSLRDNSGAGAKQEWEKSRWFIKFSVKINDAEYLKLVTGGNFTKTEGQVYIYRINQRPATVAEGHFVGRLIYREAITGDDEYPMNLPESYWVIVYVNDDVFEDTLRLCSLGHIPNMTLDFPDSIQNVNGELKNVPYGLNLEGNFRPGILWDNVKFPEVKIVSSELNFSFTSVDKEIDEDEFEEDKATAQLALPATRAQLARLIATVKFVGIGLGILAVLLHYIH